MKFTEYLIDEKQLTETPFGPFKRKAPPPAPTEAPTPRDPNETPERRFKRKLDEMYTRTARLASYCYDAGYSAEDLIEELGEVVHEMYRKKEARKGQKDRPLMRGEQALKDDASAPTRPEEKVGQADLFAKESFDIQNLIF